MGKNTQRDYAVVRTVREVYKVQARNRKQAQGYVALVMDFTMHKPDS